MTNPILDKTDKGREEIATRKYRLASRLRTLLVLIDGKHDVEDLLKKVMGLGLNEESITELLDNGFIQPITSARAAPNSERSPALAASLQESSVATLAGNVPPASETQSHAAQYQALYNFFTETIKSTIGLRGYGLQLKVERANSINDFRELRQQYVDAVLKAKGNEMARSLGDRLDQLLSADQ